MLPPPVLPGDFPPPHRWPVHLPPSSPWLGWAHHPSSGRLSPLTWAPVTPHLGTCRPSSGRLLPFTWTVVTPRMGDYHCPAPGPCSSAAPKATCVCAPQGKSQTLPQASHSAWCSRLGALSVLFPSPECFSQFPLSLFSKAFWDIPPAVTSPGPTITWGPSLPLPWCPSGSTMIVGSPLCMG